MPNYQPHQIDRVFQALSDATRGVLEAAVQEVLEGQRARARDILRREKDRLVALRDLLLERKVLDREAFAHLAPSAAPKKEPAHG